jgi:hypothetical protein
MNNTLNTGSIKTNRMWGKVFRKMAEELEYDPDKQNTHNYFSEQMTLHGYDVTPMAIRNWFKENNNPNPDALKYIVETMIALYNEKKKAGKLNGNDFEKAIINLYFTLARYNINIFSGKNKISDFIDFSLKEAYELDKLGENDKATENENNKKNLFLKISKVAKYVLVPLACVAIISSAALFIYTRLQNPVTAVNQFDGSTIKVLKGDTLLEWKTETGEAGFAAPGEGPVNIDDIQLKNENSQSVLSANVKERAIMSQNIAYNSILNEEASHYSHTVEYRFRLSGIPSGGSDRSENGQAVGGSLIINDDPDRLSYVITFQWVVNPLSEDYGAIQTWAGDNWEKAGYLQPDNKWHEVFLKMDIKNNIATLMIDNVIYPTGITRSTKKDTPEKTGARAQVDIISTYPDNGKENKFDVCFKDWVWIWRGQADTTAESARFTNINDWDEVEKEMTVTGSYPQEMKEDLWIFVKPYAGKYYPQSQDNQSVRKSGGIFEVRLGIGQDGEQGKVFDIILASATKEISSQITGDLAKGNYAGMDNLQPGIKVLKTVRVIRKR